MYTKVSDMKKLLALLEKLKFTKTQMIALGFLCPILVGALLLMLPISSADGTVTPFIDSLFMSATSVCVTGLVTVPVYLHWSLFGKVVILILIQLGGLGVVAIMTMLLIAIGKRITLKERMLIQEAYNLDTLAGMVKMIIRIVKGTFIVETAGAVCFAFVFVPQYGFLRGVFYSVFHSVSAFCNAGIDLIGIDSFVPYVSNPIVNLTTMLLIVSGGIGFTVWWDLIRVGKDAKTGEIAPRQMWSRLMLHSKLAVSVTLLLIFVPAVLYFIFEYHNPQTLGELGTGSKLMASLFQSVTTRTAGFCTIPQGELKDSSTLLTLILMFVGGSPAGTAGGVKTTTVAMILMSVMCFVRGKRDTEMFGRRVPADNVRTGLAVLTISLLVVFTNIMLLLLTDGAEFRDTIFEVVTAIGTVGLSRGLTPDLTFWGKLIIIVTMYIGRIGPITMVLAFGVRRQTKGDNRELPEKRILVG